LEQGKLLQPVMFNTFCDAEGWDDPSILDTIRDVDPKRGALRDAKELYDLYTKYTNLVDQLCCNIDTSGRSFVIVFFLRKYKFLIYIFPHILYICRIECGRQQPQRKGVLLLRRHRERPEAFLFFYGTRRFS
jgi:hypothetical protein